LQFAFCTDEEKPRTPRTAQSPSYPQTHSITPKLRRPQRCKPRLSRKLQRSTRTHHKALHLPRGIIGGIIGAIQPQHHPIQGTPRIHPQFKPFRSSMREITKPMNSLPDHRKWRREIQAWHLRNRILIGKPPQYRTHQLRHTTREGRKDWQYTRITLHMFLGERKNVESLIWRDVIETSFDFSMRVLYINLYIPGRVSSTIGECVWPIQSRYLLTEIGHNEQFGTKLLECYPWIWYQSPAIKTFDFFVRQIQ
jgi:hypothetical protein